MNHTDPFNQNNRSVKPPVVIVSDISRPTSHQVDLLGKNARQKPRRILKIILASILLAIIALGGFLVLRASDLSNKIFVGQKTTFFQKIKDAIRGGSGGIKLTGEDLGQINILLLGIGGEGHDGPYLTDTEILAQIRPDIGAVTLTSIPRDYLVSLPENLGNQKINAAFAQGFVKNHDWDEAGRWARQAAGNLTGLKIPYFAVVDFSGFEKAINEVNGIDVQVDRAFTDYEYPNNKLGYLPPVTFTQGRQHLDGARALQFVRSRHAAGPEGSDFARSQRQQKVIEAFKERVLQLNIITDSKKLNSLLSIFADQFHTNISPGEIFRIYALARENNIKNFLTLSLDPETHLVCPKIMEDTGAYVLIPCEGKTLGDIQAYFKNSFALGKLYEEKSVIWLANSTRDKTAYTAADKKLKEAALTVWEVPYTLQVLPQTVFFQVNPKPATAEFLKNTLNATEVTLSPSGFKADKSKVDVIVILGSK